jgi:peroxiredoxin
MTDKTLLHPHDPFPALTVSLPGGRALRLPDDLAGHFGVVLFYRGSWCPYCNAQLSAFQRALDDLAEMDVTVVALSVDDEATTQELIAKHGLRFPVGYGADASAIADATGAFVNDDPLFLQSTGFVLDPGGRVVVSVYSSGAIGRLVPQDVIGLIRYLREQRLASRQTARVGLAETGGEVRTGQLATPTARTGAERPAMTRPRKGHRSHDRDARHTCATGSQTR